VTTAPASTASFLSCQKCGERFGVTSSTGQPVERLADPFEAACLFCDHRGRYTKASIEILRLG
jgi:hypothetical protein